MERNRGVKKKLQMNFDLYYYFALKKREKYFDDGNRDYFFDSMVSVNYTPFQVSLISEDGEIVMARIIKEGLKEEKISDEIHDQITILKEHLLTSMNIYFDPFARIRFDIHLFIKEGEKPDLNILMQEIKPEDNHVSIDKFNEVFVNSFDMGNELKLITDAQKKYIPIQFRFLSLYKFLELEFKLKGKWGENFDAFGKTVESEFKNKKLSSRSFLNYLHEIRDKCAHVKSNNDILGVTSLSHKDEKRVNEFTKFLTIVCIEYLNQIKLKDKSFKINFFGNHNIDLA